MTFKVKYCPKKGVDVDLEECKTCEFYGGILDEEVYCTYEFNHHPIYKSKND